VRFTTVQPVDLPRTFGPLVASRADPTIVVRPDRVHRAWRTPDGPATLTLVQRAPDRFEARAVGDGADWALIHAPALVGADDDLTGFTPEAHPTVARAHRRRPGLRMIRTGRAEDVLVATILAQRVTAGEAAGSWTRLVRAWGCPAPAAPGVPPLRLAPSPEQLAGTATWAFAPFGVEHARAARIVGAARQHRRVQAAVDAAVAGDHVTARTRLAAVPGIGPWTAGHLLRVAGGDPDAVEVGDFHVKHHVAWNLAGEPRASDERMLELLTPFAGHRGRVVRLLLSTAPRAPSYGPRRRVTAIDRL
jgi:3-methyladenine DNA glycosylase/8-oxoguanine DNA glycosylase